MYINFNFKWKKLLLFHQVNLFFLPHAVADGVKAGQLLQGQDGVSKVQTCLITLDCSHPVTLCKQVLQN